MVQYHERIWVSLSFAMVWIGYMIPPLGVTLWPTFQLYWGNSVVSLIILSWTGAGGARVAWLIMVASVLVGWGWFLRSKNIRYVWYGLLPTLVVGVIYFVMAIFMVVYGGFLVPFNSIVLFGAALVVNRAKPRIMPSNRKAEEED
ncbi:MAG: hypothetical protein Q6364_10370 [Candidatus Hermodarchaeota archaeon]|nr:hypothetical protein [Candidatus Hermodarchaeota archaeon]